MITFLFWNTNKKAPIDSTIKLVNKYDIDFLLLAEFDEEHITDILEKLNQERDILFHYAPSNCERINLFSIFSTDYIVPILESSYLTIQHINLPERENFLLAVAHLRSKLHLDEDSQILECTGFAEDISQAEEQTGTTKTILVGDFNMNPFEAGVVGSRGFHAIMTQNIAEKRKRTVAGREYLYFYNPMWSFFGDLSNGPPGSYYMRKAQNKCYFWNIFDQVLVRPDLLQHFDTKKLKILTNDGENEFLNDKGVPDKENISDHLPILFTLNI